MNGEIKCIIFCLLLMISSCGKKDGSAGEELKVILPEVTQPTKEFPLEYRIGLFQDELLDPLKVTHIIVIGSAMHEDSDQFFQSGISRAYRYKELWPERQVVIMSTPDVINRTDEQVFAKYKINVVKKVDLRFTANLLIAEIGAFEKIASLDFFGHSSPWALKIDDVQAPFDPSVHVRALSKLRPKFLPNAYVTLNGCNTGFSIAPDLSSALELPVSGSLTSSVFERIESDGHWYKEDDQSKLRYVSTNRVSYDKKLICATGACTRMKSSRHNYSSFWGYFKDGGLSFDKFFCNFVDFDGRCERGMAMSLLGFPSVRPISLKTSIEDFKDVVYDWLCSTGSRNNYFKKCIEGIEDAVNQQHLVYQSHPTNELNCDFKSCNVKVECDFEPDSVIPKPGTCRVVTMPNPNPINVASEYVSLINGFIQIQEY